MTHEGTSQVKESKINILVHKYELFKIEPHETISDIFIRFTKIINELKSLRKDYSNSDLVCKIFIFLSKTWKAKVIIIQEAKNLSKLLWKS